MRETLNVFKATAVSWLRRFERVTQTDNVYLAKNIWLVGGSQLFTILNGFVVYLLIARFVDPALFGSYRYLVAILELSAITTVTGMKIALLRSVSNGYEGSLQASLRKRLMAGYAFGLPLLAGSGWYAIHQNPELAAALAVIYAFGPVYYATSGYVSFLQGKKLFKDFSILALVNEAFLLVGTLYAIFFAKSALVFFLVYFAANLDNILFYFFALRKQENERVDPELMPHAVHQSKLDALFTVASRVDGVIVFHFLGPIVLAGYTFAILTADQLKTAASVIYTVAGPKLASNPLEQILKTLWRKMLLLMVFGASLAVAYILIAPFAYQILFPKYASYVLYSQVYAVSLIFYIPALYGSYLFNVRHMKRESSVFNTFNQTLLIAMLVIGGWTAGLWGIVAARLLSSVFQLASFGWIIQHAEKPSTSLGGEA